MFGQATAHRRANAFAQALEALPDDGDAADDGAGSPAHAADRHADPEQAAMLALADRLAQRPRPALDPEKKIVQRAQLIAAMEQAIADGSFAAGRVPEQRGPRPAGRGTRAGLHRFGPRSKLSRRIAVGGLTVGVAAGALGGVAAASTNALPGDTLYGLKRGMEDIKLDMAGGDTARGQVYLDMASTRMQEARRLMDRGRGGQLDPDSVREVRRALSGMHQEVAEAHRLLTKAYQDDGSLRPIEVLDHFAQSHRQGWSDLRQKLPSQLTDVSEQVSSAFAAIDQEVAPLKRLLPRPQQSASTPGSSRTTAGAGGQDGSGRTGAAGPSASASPGDQQQAAGGTGTSSPTPSASGTPGTGLIGGTGLLGTNPTSTATPTSTPTGTPTSQNHQVVLPPLLPGLLPGLGISGGDDGTTG